MAAPPPLNPPPVAPPVPSNDPNVPMPAAPVFPPTVNNVLEALAYRRNVEVSMDEQDDDIRCTLNDHYNSVLYEHGVVSQAVAAAAPQAVAPAWFQAAIQQLRIDIRNDIRNDIRADILPDLKQLINRQRGEGDVVPFEIVPFNNGTDPTQPPNNLPPLHSVNAIQNLNGHDLVSYLHGYNVIPAPGGPNPHATNRLQKDILKKKVGASKRS